MPSLDILPVEVFERICLAADKFDLPSLRLVSRDCATKSLRTFSHAHFSHRSVLLSDIISIEDAIYLSKHHTFGKVARHLSICLDDVSFSHDGPYQPSLPLNNHARARLGRLHHLVLQRIACRSSNAVLNALTVLLMRVRKHVTSITITDVEGVRFSGMAPPTMSDEWREFVGIPHVNELRRAYCTILEAMAISEIQVEELRMANVNLSFEPHYFDNEDMGYDVLKSVKRMEIETCVELGANMGNVQSFVNVLAKAPVLQDLEVKVASTNHTSSHLTGDEFDESILIQLLTLKRFAKLERLSIVGASLGVRGLATFSRKQPALRRLELRNLWIQDYEQVTPNDENMEQVVKRLSGLSDVEIENVYA